jgi:fatty acid-binding protein DegV
MKTRILAGSTSKLPRVFVERHGISMCPMYINIGQQGYQAGVDFKRQELPLDITPVLGADLGLVQSAIPV